MSLTLKKSRQRDAIMSFLQSRTDHPSADAIYVHMRQIMPNISLGTVYRNLSLLCELGHITKIPCDDKVERYDARVAPHNHFVCDKCGCVVDLEMDSVEHIKEIAGENFAGQISGYSLFFHGMCEDCLNQEEMASEV